MVGPLRHDSPAPKKAKELPPILQGPGAAPVPQEAPKKPERPATVSGFIENALDDAWELAKGLYEIIPSTVKSYQENVPYILKNAKWLTPGMVGQAAKESAKAVGGAVAEPYKKHGAGVVYQRPVTVLSDLITVLTLGGGSIKNAGKLARAAGAGEKAERIIQAGKWLEELPAKMARKGVDATVKAATGGKLDLAKRREFLALKGEEQGRRILKIEQDAKNVLEKIDALVPEEKALFHKARVFGDVQGYGVPDAALPQNVKAALDAYTDLVNRVDPNMIDHGITAFYKSRGYLDEATAQTTLAKKFALEAFDDVSTEAVQKARALIDQAKAEGRRLPVYGQNVFVDEVGRTLSADTVLDDLITGGKHVREGKVNPLEKMAGARGYTKDPSVYTREMIKNFRQTEAKARLSERLLEEKALISGGAGGLTPDSIPEGIHRKYYQDRIRAEALKSVTDPTIQRLLKWEYIKNNSSLIRLYDRIHGLFARAATKWNPKWVTGNVIGDAVLGLLAGADWVQGARYLRRGVMPAQIAARGVTLSTQDILEQPGRLSRTVGYLPEKAADLAGYIDQATRAGIISKEAGRRLKEAGVSFEGSAEALENVLRSTDRFSDVQVQMRLLTERIARRTPIVLSKSKKIAKLEELEKAIHEKLLALDARSKERAIAKAEVAKNADVASDMAVLRETQRRISSLANAERALRGRASAAGKAIEKERGRRLDSPKTIKKDFPERLLERPEVISHQLQEVQETLADYRVLRDLQRASIRYKLGKPAKSADAALGGFIEASFRRGVDALDSLRQKILNLNAENRAIIRDILDDAAKRGDLEHLVPALREQVAIVRPAIERANAFVGDYLALDGFEQGVLRRAIPFYPWAKAMSMLAFRLPFLAPVKTFAWNRFSDALMTLVDDPELPEDFRGRVPVAVTADGRTVWAKLTAYSPFESLKTSSVAEIPVPGMLNLAERNPFIGLAFQFFGGKTIWDASSIPYGEQMVSIGDGTVIRVKPNGKVERDIPQAPLVSSIMHTFPTVQLVQQVLTPYWTNKYGWAGFPEPILNSDGSYKYPRELWDRLGAAVGLNLQTRSREDIVRARKAKAIRNVNEMRVQYRRTNDPDEREMILNAMRDTISQEIHGRRP